MSSSFWHLFPWQVLTRTAGIDLTCKLQDGLDAALLAEEAERILAEFKPVGQHGDDHAGGWKAISLISSGGDPFEGRNLPGVPSEKTPALKIAPYIESVLDGFDCKKQRVRMMQLLPGETILWHVDPSESVDAKNARIHIPVVTNPGIQFQISHEDCRWLPGEVWYGDFTFPHRLHNGGSEGRIHLVMDLEVNDYVRGLFPQAYLDAAGRRDPMRSVVERLVRWYTLPRYRLGYMKKKQEGGAYQAT